MLLKNWLLGASAVVLGGVAPMGPAWAQSAEPSASTLDEVVVTARRREESAQSVPVSVTALSAAALEQRNVESLEDLTRVTPGFRFAAEGGGQNTTVSLRGLSKVPLGDGTPAVVSYFAEVPLPAEGSNLPTFDLSSIQVLKGPQGTLFGKNTIGGAVLVTPKAPDYVQEGYVKASVGNYDYRAFEGALNLPIVDDKLALRVAAQVRDRDGFQKNVGLGPDYDDLNQYSIRASVLFQPTERLTNTFIFDYFNAKEAPTNTVLYKITPGILTAFGAPFNPDLSVGAGFEAPLAAAFAAQQARGVRTIDSDAFGARFDREIYGFTNNSRYELSDNLALKNIFGFRVSKTLYDADSDGGPTLHANPVGFEALTGLGLPVDELRILNVGARTDRRQLTDEIQLVGSSFDNKLEWIVGLFYSKEEPNGPQGSFFEQFNFRSSVVPPSGLNFAPAGASTSHTRSESKAVFGQIGYNLSDFVEGLKLNVGYRYTWDEVAICGLTAPGGTTTSNAPFLSYGECKAFAGVSPVDGAGVLSTKDNAPTWTVGLDWQVNSNLFLYATGRHGYRGSGINTPVFETPGTSTNGPGAVDIRNFQFVGPEKITDVEVGVKSDFEVGGMRARLNVSAFASKYKDAVQFINVLCCISPIDPGLPTRGSFGLNAADLTIRGAELEATLAPTRALTFTLTSSYLHQKVDSVAGVPAPFSLTADQVTLPSPDFSGAFAVRWVLPVHPLEGDLALNGDYYWTNSWQAQGEPLPGYEVANFKLDWTNIGGRSLDASLFVTNAFDKDYIQSPVVALRGFPVNAGMYGPPRMYGVELTYRFGG